MTAFVLSLLQGPDTRLRGTEVADQVLHRFARDMNTTAAQLAERIAPHLPAGASDHLTGLAARLAEIARNLRHEGRPATDAMESDEQAERMDLSVHAVMVGNAGLVLLWPDLPLYFERAGLMSGRDFATPAQHRCAVLLLHHLATGSPAAPEHALTLSKLLCGLEPQTPVEPSVTLSARDIDLANGLLQGLCQRWSPLKRTSIEGLRETFLCRRGILRRPEAAGPLTLHVEAGPFDVLLDRLPWSISTVRTPWMREALFVNWR